MNIDFDELFDFEEKSSVGNDKEKHSKPQHMQKANQAGFQGTFSSERSGNHMGNVPHAPSVPSSFGFNGGAGVDDRFPDNSFSNAAPLEMDYGEAVTSFSSANNAPRNKLSSSLKYSMSSSYGGQNHNPNTGFAEYSSTPLIADYSAMANRPEGTFGGQAAAASAASNAYGMSESYRANASGFPFHSQHQQHQQQQQQQQHYQATNYSLHQQPSTSYYASLPVAFAQPQSQQHPNSNGASTPIASAQTPGMQEAAGSMGATGSISYHPLQSSMHYISAGQQIPVSSGGIPIGSGHYGLPGTHTLIAVAHSPSAASPVSASFQGSSGGGYSASPAPNMHFVGSAGGSSFRGTSMMGPRKKMDEMYAAMTPAPMLDKINEKRERNRLAAERCRKKKSELIENLQTENDELKGEIDRLKQELLSIRQLVQMPRSADSMPTS